MGWMVDDSTYSWQDKRFIFNSRRPDRLWAPSILLFNDYHGLSSGG